MKYILMCGGNYGSWRTPRQLTKINGEPIITRTMRLLKENGIEDIAISSNDPVFEQFGVPVLNHQNDYTTNGVKIVGGHWCECFYPMNEPVCYIFGDVVFSPNAISTIVKTQTDDIMLFASAPPFSKEYKKPWAEPFALKVQNTRHLQDSVRLCKKYEASGMFNRKPIMWELWQVIQGTPLNHIDYNNYIAINDYTCDIDHPSDAAMFQNIS